MTGNVEKISISSEGEVPLLERFIEEMLDYYNVPGEYFGNIFLAVVEAVHLGLKGEKGGKVQVRIRKKNGGLVFGITRSHLVMEELDELDRARADQVIARETFIIRSLADKTEITNRGRTIELRFHIAGISPERALIRSEKLRGYLAGKEKVMGRNE